MNIKRKKKVVIKLKLPKLSITKFEELFENLLPFWNILVCSEGYERAKNILKGEYGKTSEIINAYVHNILELPILTSPDPKRVNAFYKTLLHKVQSLETPTGQIGASEWNVNARPQKN